MRTTILAVLVVLLFFCSAQVRAEAVTQNPNLGNVKLFFVNDPSGGAAYPYIYVSTSPSMAVDYSLQPSSVVLNGSFNEGYIEICPGTVQVATTSISGSGTPDHAGLTHQAAVQSGDVLSGGGTTLNLRFNTPTTDSFTTGTCSITNVWSIQTNPCWQTMGGLQYDSIAAQYYPRPADATPINGRSNLSLYCGARVEVKKDASTTYAGNLEGLNNNIDFSTEGLYGLKIDIGNVTCAYLARSLHKTQTTPAFNPFSSEKFCLTGYGSTNCQDNLYKYDVPYINFTVRVSDPRINIQGTLVTSSTILLPGGSVNASIALVNGGNAPANVTAITVTPPSVTFNPTVVTCTGSGCTGYSYTLSPVNIPVPPDGSAFVEINGTINASLTYAQEAVTIALDYVNTTPTCTPQSGTLYLSFAPPEPDLISSCTDVAGDVGTNVIVTTRTSNIGGLPAGASTTRVVAGSNPAVYFGIPPLSSLAYVDNQTTVSCLLVPGQILITTNADYYDDVAEGNEGNNMGSCTVTCGGEVPPMELICPDYI